MSTTIWLAFLFLAFALGCLSVGVLRYSKDEDGGKSAFEKFCEAYDEVDVERLDDKQLERYDAICTNGGIEAMMVKRDRDINAATLTLEE